MDRVRRSRILFPLSQGHGLRFGHSLRTFFFFLSQGRRSSFTFSFSPLIGETGPSFFPSFVFPEGERFQAIFFLFLLFCGLTQVMAVFFPP